MHNFASGIADSNAGVAAYVFPPQYLVFASAARRQTWLKLQKLVDDTAAYHMGVVLLSRHEVVELGREQLINVWVSNQGPDWTHDLRMSNLDLAILMAYQLAQNWNGRINLCMAVE